MNEAGDSWKAEVAPMRSAYKEKLGAEPSFTNWAKVKEDVSYYTYYGHGAPDCVFIRTVAAYYCTTHCTVGRFSQRGMSISSYMLIVTIV